MAARLGFDEATIARLQARGHLERLALSEAKIRERIYRAHLAYLRTRAGCTESSRGTITFRRSPQPFRLERS
jgi:hypothetical protein